MLYKYSFFPHFLLAVVPVILSKVRLSANAESSRQTAYKSSLSNVVSLELVAFCGGDPFKTMMMLSTISKLVCQLDRADKPERKKGGREKCFIVISSLSLSLRGEATSIWRRVVA